MLITEKLVDVKEHLVREFYTSTMHILKATKVTMMCNLKVKFDQHTLNAYMVFDDVEPKYYLEKLAPKEDARPWLAEILAPGPTPSWIATGMPILWNTLSFEAKGWQSFVCSRLDPFLNVNNLPIPRGLMMASIMDGYPINVGTLMLANISLVAQ